MKILLLVVLSAALSMATLASSQSQGTSQSGSQASQGNQSQGTQNNGNQNMSGTVSHDQKALPTIRTTRTIRLIIPKR
jgi:hypothetical protein